MLLTCWIVAAAFVLSSTCVNIDISVTRDDTPAVKIEDVRFEVEVADTQRLREIGLAGRTYLEERNGMLFVPEGPEVGPFWMKGMLFPLDFIWISSDCRVVDVSPYTNVPRPGTPDNEIRRYRSYPSAVYTLEVNSGEADRFRIRVGDKVKFENIDGRC